MKQMNHTSKLSIILILISPIYALQVKSKKSVFFFNKKTFSSPCHLCFCCETAGSCVDAIVTDHYGLKFQADGFITNIDINQGRVYQISGWGIQTYYTGYEGVSGLEWLSDEQTTFHNEYGWATPNQMSSCSTWVLDDDDYINGYNIRYTNDSIGGITFYTKNNEIYSCITYVNAEEMTITGNIIYPNRYLSGFYVKSGLIINGISFQFTAINNTNKCVNTSKSTLQPTTSSPTTNPPTTNPPTTSPPTTTAPSTTIIPPISVSNTDFMNISTLAPSPSTTMSSTSLYSTGTPTKTTTETPVKTVIVKVGNSGLDISIIIGLLLVTMCCILPILVGITICFCYRRWTNKLDAVERHNRNHRLPPESPETEEEEKLQDIRQQDEEEEDDKDESEDTITFVAGPGLPLKNDQQSRSGLSGQDSLKSAFSITASVNKLNPEVVHLKMGNEDTSLNIEGYDKNAFTMEDEKEDESQVLHDGIVQNRGKKKLGLENNFSGMSNSDVLYQAPEHSLEMTTTTGRTKTMTPKRSINIPQFD